MTNPKRAIYNRIYNRTTFGVGNLTRGGRIKKINLVSNEEPPTVRQTRPVSVSRPTFLIFWTTELIFLLISLGIVATQKDRGTSFFTAFIPLTIFFGVPMFLLIAFDLWSFNRKILKGEIKVTEKPPENSEGI